MTFCHEAYKVAKAVFPPFTIHFAGQVSASNFPTTITKREFINSEFTGIFYTHCKSGQLVQKGMKIGYITDLSGKWLADIHSPVNGLIIYQVSTPPINKGEILFSLAVL